MREGQAAALDLAIDDDPGRRREGDGRLERAAYLDPTVREHALGRDDQGGVLFVDLGQGVEVAGVERGLQQGVRLFGLRAGMTVLSDGLIDCAEDACLVPGQRRQHAVLRAERCDHVTGFGERSLLRDCGQRIERFDDGTEAP